MKYMLVFYDCNICKKAHILKAEWSLRCEMDMKDWSLDVESELAIAVASLLSRVKSSFAKLHPNGVFSEDRLAFSQLFEETENEKGTAKAKI